ncbi:YfzA family protein [Virgibacillus sp. 6R]|uniref:YfzA family protein n=1 Tax=Metabacillus sp. 22489 TaxID=3453928 RepID=UPI0011A7557A
MAEKEKSVPFFKKSWVSQIGVFLLSQIIFITFEQTGWLPNYREIDGTLFGRITESAIFKEWFTFYETPQLNLITVFFGIFFLVPGIIGALKNVFSLRHYSSSSK